MKPVFAPLAVLDSPRRPTDSPGRIESGKSFWSKGFAGHRPGWRLLLLCFFASVPGWTQAATSAWVSTWACGPQLTEPHNLPPVPLSGTTLRQFVHVTLGGSQIRLRFSNLYGTEPVEMHAVHVALAAGDGSAGAGTINVATDHALQFHGQSAVVLAPGAEVWSDPCDFALPRLTNLAVSIYFDHVSATSVNGHPGSRTTSFIQSGEAVTAESLTTASKTAHWYFITAVDVVPDHSSQTLAILGDSITDGRGSTTDGNNRWPDLLASRLATNASTAQVAVVNLGIGGNALFGGLGPAAVKRFDGDILGQSGVRWVVVFEGVNDIGGAWRGGIATNIISADTEFARKAHARNLLIYGATITPFGGNHYYTPGHEQERQTVNAWLRTNQLFDGCIDFDAAVRDPATQTNLAADYDSGDGLHLNPAGYGAMAEAVRLDLFTH